MATSTPRRLCKLEIGEAVLHIQKIPIRNSRPSSAMVMQFANVLNQLEGERAIFWVDGERSEEIASLTRTQRLEVVLWLSEMKSTEAETEDIVVCEHSAAMGFALLEAMEAEDNAP